MLTRRNWLLFLLLAPQAGCGGDWYRKSADEEVYPIVNHERASLLGEETPFEVEQTTLPLDSVSVPGQREDLPRVPAPVPPPPPAAPDPAAAPAPPPLVPDALARAPKVRSRILDIQGALRLAFANNRDYQARKEAVYLSALSLTLARHAFAPRLFGLITGEWDHEATAESGSVSPSFGWSLLFTSGARVSINLLQNFFQFFTGDRREVAATIVSGTLTQPLLRGFGSEIVREPVTQAERDVTYEVRAFERFRKTFAVQVISEFYRVLELRDRVTNAYLNWQSLVVSRDRVQALAQAGFLPRFQVDQAQQNELEAQDQWNSAVERFESSLDGFKITLGISVDEDLTLSQTELDRLARLPVQSLGVSAPDAVSAALAERLDLLTARDQIEDAARSIRVAEEGLRAQLDLVADASIESGTGGAQTPLKFNANHFAYGFGFDLDLPLDRKAERNAYVASIIAHEKRRRDATLFEDTIRLTVRDAHRRLEREVVNHRIQQASLTLAQERVASTSLLLQAGRAETRDFLESQSALNGARNALTSSLINYEIARLEFLRDTEALRAADDGRLTELPIRGRSEGGA